MGKAKTASKNNPTAREQAKKFFFNDQEIRPVEIFIGSKRILGAEFEKTKDLVLSNDGNPMTWNKAKLLSTTNL